MKYAIVPLAQADARQMSDYLGTLNGRGVRVLYDGYAPSAWIVEYSGSPRQLTDLIWPDERPRKEWVTRVGFVIRLRNSTANINGVASEEFWDLIIGADDASG